MPDHLKSVFADDSVWKYRYACTLHAYTLTGGVPNDPKVARAWLATKLTGRDAVLDERLRETLAERQGLDPSLSDDDAFRAAVEEVAVSVNGFKRIPTGVLCEEGRHAKAALKEAASIATLVDNLPRKLGAKLNAKSGAETGGKMPKSYVAEHVHIVEDLIPLHRDGVPVTEPTEVSQHFVHAIRAQGPVTAIDYSEVVEEVDLDLTVLADTDLDELWPILWTTAEQNGLGARRSQGSGKFTVVRWDRVE